MRYLLTLDAGTTSLKSALFRENGDFLGSVMKEYTLLTPVPNIVELEPEVYWETCKKVIRDLLEKTKVKTKEIVALSISTQGETFVVLDKEGKSLRRAIVWYDNRSVREAGLIKDEFGIEHLFKVTGQPEIIPTWPSTKILWIRENEPKVFNKIHKILLLEDYLMFKFTGEFATERSLTSDTLLLDIRNGKWWKEMLNFLGISEDQLPVLKYSGDLVGNITKEAAQETGLSRETMVVAGAMDQIAGAIGAGNITPGIITETTGAALAICTTINKPVYDPKMRIPCFYHAMKDRYILMPWCQTAGMVLRWFRDQFCRWESEKAQRKNRDTYDILTQEAEKISPGSEGLIMLPHLSGAACPEFNPNAKGVFFGFTLSHTKGHFIRAIMESIAFMLKKNIQLLEDLDIEVNEIRSSGGAARSRLWNQIKADVVNKIIITTNIEEAASLGVAMLAGIGVGLFPSLEKAAQKMVSQKEKFIPNSEYKDTYAYNYNQYCRLYDSVVNLF